MVFLVDFFYKFNTSVQPVPRSRTNMISILEAPLNSLLFTTYTNQSHPDFQ